MSMDKEIPSLCKTVFGAVDNDFESSDRIVVHRLGMDTSGLVVFAKTMQGVRGMNTLFRTRKITREYEALLCGHVTEDESTINMPLMMDYFTPPYMRVSNRAHQEALVDLDPEIVGKKILERPKNSLTHVNVIAREELNELPVTRVKLTSVSGRYVAFEPIASKASSYRSNSNSFSRTHQLNVHCAAIGHPIVGDTVYGIGGVAASNGGLELDEFYENAPNRASEELQQQIAEATKGKSMCVHAKSVSFRHPVTKTQVEVNSKTPF